MSRAAPGMQPIRVLVADSSRMASELICDALRQNARLTVVAAPGALEELSATVSRLHPHVLVAGVGVSGAAHSAFHVLREVHMGFPKLEIVALTDDSSSESVLDSFRAGAHGIISRDKSPDELLKCVCSVYQGQIWATTEQLKLVLEAYSQESVRSMVDKHASDLLSKRELEVIRAVARGLSNRQIAAHLRVSEHTVKNQLFRIFSKLGISSRTELVLFALNSRNAI